MEERAVKNVIAFGYAGFKKLSEVIELLNRFEVGILVDVRRFPKSKNPHFTRESLEAELPKHGIRYIYMGESLGGYRRGGYQKYTETEHYREGIRRLVELVEEAEGEGKGVAVMCLERRARYCHRRFIIQTLSEMGIEVAEVEG